jgi:cold-inducible RNA-binding protein
MNIYVGNLAGETTEDDLRRAFEAFGQVRSVNIVRDKISGESRGFGFVGMPTENEARTAISEMNGKDLQGRTVKVEEGRVKPNYGPTREKRRGFSGDRGRGERRGSSGGDRGGGSRRGGSSSRGGRRY